MNSNEIRQRFLKFFENRGHKIIPSASLIPENDPSVLFNTAGMQPIVPYLLGQKHPMGARLVDVQKCVRTGDIDEVGDNRHLTFFEMLGNWSLGDYFKEEAIKWSFEFLTDKEEGLGLDIKRIYVTVFEGNDDAPRDMEAFEIWKKYLPENRIYFLPAKNNWWSAGESGPCGPDTEIFYDPNEIAIGDMVHDEFVKADDEGRVIEIWNNVFMQFEKKDGKVVGKLTQHNVDTGMGLERITMVSQKVKTVFDTDLFGDAIDILKNSQNGKYYNEYSARIVLDHIRTATFLISDGVLPDGKSKGYVLRKLIRRAKIEADKLGFGFPILINLSQFFINFYKDYYLNLKDNDIPDVILKELEKFNEAYSQARQKIIRTFEFKNFNSKQQAEFIFDLEQSFGINHELTIPEIFDYQGVVITDEVKEILKTLIKEHQDLSRTSSAGMFKGGLANHSEKTIKLHTAHHLLLAGLQAIVSPDIKQKGSNITEERLRMDFVCDHKLTDEEKQKVEDWVNDKIERKLNVVRREMPLAEAEKIGAQMEFGAKYPEVVSIYFVEDEEGNAISKEFCGGPHVENTGDLAANPEGTPKHFKIQKEEASSQGVRRIKAVLE